MVYDRLMEKVCIHRYSSGVISFLNFSAGSQGFQTRFARDFARENPNWIQTSQVDTASFFNLPITRNMGLHKAKTIKVVHISSSKFHMFCHVFFGEDCPKISIAILYEKELVSSHNKSWTLKLGHVKRFTISRAEHYLTNHICTYVLWKSAGKKS